MMKLIFQINIKGFFKLILSFQVCVASNAQVTQNNKLRFLCNVSRQKQMMKLFFCMYISMKTGHNQYYDFDGYGKAFPKFPKQQVCNVFIISPEKKSQKLQVDFNTLGIKVSSKAILSSLMGMINHSQRTQSKKFAISLQYLKKEVRSGLYHQRFYKLPLSFLIEEARVPKIGSW